jgi:hypothetical protein
MLDESEVDYEAIRKVVDEFEHDGDLIHIFLEKRGETLAVLARYAGGGLVDGYEYHVDNIGDMTLEVASSIGTVKEMYLTAKNAVLTRRWERFNQELEMAGLLRRINT